MHCAQVGQMHRFVISVAVVCMGKGWCYCYRVKILECLAFDACELLSGAKKFCNPSLTVHFLTASVNCNICLVPIIYSKISPSFLRRTYGLSENFSIAAFWQKFRLFLSKQQQVECMYCCLRYFCSSEFYVFSVEKSHNMCWNLEACTSNKNVFIVFDW
jgi:hypothetical protein